MSITPASHDLNRSNPYIARGINKSLLSRCPRVGLSRKRTPKTPGTPGTASLIEVETTPPTSKIEPKEELKRNKVSKRLLQEQNQNAPEANENRLKSDLKVDKNDSDDDNLILARFKNKKEKSPNMTIEKSKSVEIVKNNTECIGKDVIKSMKQDNSCSDFKQKEGKKLNKCQKTEEIGKLERNEIKSGIENTKKRIRKRPRRLLSEDANDESPIVILNETVSPQRANAKPKNKACTTNSTNSLKSNVEKELKSAKNVDNISKFEEKLEESPIKDEKMSESATNRKRARHTLSENEDDDNKIATLNEKGSSLKSPLKPKIEANLTKTSPELKVLKTNEKPLKTYQKPVKMKRSLSLKKTLSCRTDDEEFDDLLLQDCLVSLSPLEAAKSETIIGDMDTLEKQIIEKRKILDELKQAEIYQKKHDVGQLEKLTRKYKEGCIEALRDLKKHANVNTTTLLSNLGVPKDLISTTDID